MKADLHVHSTASDGTLAPYELVALALESDVAIIAIADHDSVEGVQEALNSARETSLNVIPAVELSSVADGRDIHMLGYFVDHLDAVFLGYLSDMRDARLRRARTMVEALDRAGYAITLDEVLSIAGDGSVGRSHVARALVAAGHAHDLRDAFTRLIGRDRPFYVSKDVRSPAEAIEIITSAGGLAVLAHPGIQPVDDLIPGLVTSGLGGIEAYHADHSLEDRERYAAMAESLGVLVTGGSDFHGFQAPNPAMGSVPIPEHALRAILEWGSARA